MRGELALPLSLPSGSQFCRPSRGADSRHRDIFPLPWRAPGAAESVAGNSFSRSSRRRWCRRAHREADISDCVFALNSLQHGGWRPVPGANPRTNAAQAEAVGNIRSMVKDFGLPPGDLSPAGAFTELCRSLEYGGGAAAPAHLAPLDVDLL